MIYSSHVETYHDFDVILYTALSISGNLVLTIFARVPLGRLPSWTYGNARQHNVDIPCLKHIAEL